MPLDFQPGSQYRVDARDHCPESLTRSGPETLGPSADPAFANRGQTTHFTTADAEGNVVSWTSTIEQFFGSGITTLGSPGGPTIITTVVQIVLNVAEFGMSLPAAIEAPRMYADTDPTVFVEPGVPKSVRQQLTDAGHTLEVLDGPILGNVQSIQFQDGQLLGIGDFRRNSAVEGG